MDFKVLLLALDVLGGEAPSYLGKHQMVPGGRFALTAGSQNLQQKILFSYHEHHQGP